jgi:hypothetical protein
MDRSQRVTGAYWGRTYFTKCEGMGTPSSLYMSAMVRPPMIRPVPSGMVTWCWHGYDSKHRFMSTVNVGTLGSDEHGAIGFDDIDDDDIGGGDANGG